MKKFLLLLFLFFSFSAYAQLDREHWFAPMMDRTSNFQQNQNLYLSTNRTTPFAVQIFNNNVLIGTVVISKNNPQKFAIDRDFIITTSQTDLFTPITKGLYVKADYAFYANLRFSVFNHAEIITSKGIPSTGTTFFAAFAPIVPNNPILNFMTSILATQDNTTVTVSGYKPTVVFSNGATGATQPTITFTLNKGQSYIIDGRGIVSGNLDGFLGAKIVSSKPINVTNGNFNGQYAVNSNLGSDILMDQSVPVDKLGNEFALVKGNGSIGSGMEKALIIATENNTQIFVNNEVVPLATLNTGEYFLVNDDKYINQGSGHYNLYIKTSKNAYVYQLLAGTSNSSEIATGGFNFIPGLNCYLPKEINEIGFIDENLVFSNQNQNGVLSIPTKLNIITEAGAAITINGTVPPVGTGPFAMSGTSNWVTYGIPNTTGTITVSSNKAVTAGITSGSDAVGYGGFFAGFSTQPVIIKTGECIPGISLTIDPLVYDTYQWYKDGVIIPGATNAVFVPTTPGFYTCSVTMGSCAPLVTEPLKVLNCMKQSAISYSICSNLVITPAFSSSSQNPVPATVNIVTQPAFGTVVVNSTNGQITYTSNTPNVATTDTFSYQFCGDNVLFPDCETVTVTINTQPVSVNNVALNVCNINGTGTFNLATANVTSNNPVTITYYPTLADAQAENPAALILNPTTYSSSGGVVFAVVKNPIGCKNIAQISLSLFPLAVVSAPPFFSICDDDLDGFAQVDFSTITPQVIANSAYFSPVSYYLSQADANAGNTNTLPNLWSYNTNTIVYIRVNSPDGCAPVIAPISFQIGQKIALTTNTITTSVCDDDLDGVKETTLNAYTALFTTDPTHLFTFHNTLADATSGANSINPNVLITNTATYFIRFTKAGWCQNIGTLNLNVRIPKKSDILKDKSICINTLTSLDAGPGFDAYLWSNGATTSSISNVPAGTYWVDLTFNGCVYRQSVTISANALPQITGVDINGSTVSIGVSGGVPPYEYSLDGNTWQSSNVFYNVQSGNYLLYIRDSINCDNVTQRLVILNLINAITPNGDGINDVIDYSSLMNKNNLVFRIFDRYGAELFRGTPENRYIWDGNIKGRPVPTANYWYIISWKEPGTNSSVQYTSWLIVKHRNDSFFDK